MSVVALPLALKNNFPNDPLQKLHFTLGKFSLTKQKLIYNGNVVTAYLSLAGIG